MDIWGRKSKKKLVELEKDYTKAVDSNKVLTDRVVKADRVAKAAKADKTFQPPVAAKVPATPPEEDTKAAVNSTFFSSVIWSSSILPNVSFSDDNLERLLAASSWAYTAMTTNAASISNLPPVVQEKKDGVWVKTDKYEDLNSFIDDPFGPDDNFPYWSWNEFMTLIVLHRYLAGECYLKPIIVDGDRLYAVIPLFSPQKVKLKEVDSKGIARKYEYLNVEYNRNELITISATKISGFGSAVSPLRAAMGDITIDTYASERVKATMKNSFAPGLILSSNDTLTPAKAEETVNEMVENYSAAGAEGLPWYVSAPMTIVPGPTVKDLQYVNTMKWSRESLLAVFGLPPAIAGIMNSSNYNILSQSTKVHWEGFLYPIVNSIYAQLNSQLIRPLYGKDVRLWYNDTDTEIGRLKRLEKIEEAQKLVTLGYSVNTANEAAGLGLPMDPKLGIVNSALLMAGRVVPDTDEPEDKPVEDEKDTDTEEGKE